MKSLFSMVTILCMSHSLIGQIQWEHTGGPEGLGNFTPYHNQDYAFLYDSYQLYRTGDGQTWEVINTTPSGKIVVTDNKISIYSERNQGTDRPKEIQFVLSADNGETWYQAPVPPPAYHNVNHVLLCSHGIYFKTGNELYRSQTDGQSWKQVTYDSISFGSLFTSDDRVFGKNGDKIFEYNHLSGRWIFSWNMPASSDLEAIYVKDTNIIVKTGNKIFSSLNNGAVWITFPALSPSNTYLIEKNNKIYFLSGQLIRYTEDGGYSWKLLQLNNPYQNYSLIKDKFLLFSSDSDCVLFDDINMTYAPANQGLVSSAIRNIWASQNHIWAQLKFDNSFHKYDVNSGEWSPSGIPEPHSPNPLFQISKSGYLLYEKLISIDKGTTWNSLQLPFSQPNELRNIFWIGDFIYVEGDINNYISKDFGTTWNNVSRHLISGGLFKNKIWGVERPGILIVSADTAQTWADAGTEWENLQSLHVTEDRIFVINTSSNPAIYSSVDGVNWKYSTDGIPWTLIGGSNNLKRIGKVNDTYFFQRNNAIFYFSADYCSSWERISLNTNGGELALTKDSMYLGGFSAGGVFKTKMPRFNRQFARGSIFHDLNRDGIKDQNETFLSDVQLLVGVASGLQLNYFTLSDQDGQFEIRPSVESNDTLRPNILSKYVESIEPPFYVTHDSIEKYDFAVRFLPDVTDAAVSGKFNIQPVAGKELSTHITFQNRGLVSMSGRVGLKLDPEFTFINSSPPPAEIIGTDSLVWHFEDLPIFSKNQIAVTGTLSLFLPDGSLITNSANIIPDNADADLSDNHVVIQDTIVSLFTTDKKRVFPAEGMSDSEVIAGKELEYTIMFQNPFDHVINSVQISDALAGFLDYKSIRIVGASHEISKWELLPSGILRVFFDNMNLAPNSIEDQRNQGYFSFAISIRKDIIPHYNFTNTATIIYDNIKPATTNTVSTRRLEEVILSTENVSTESLRKLSIIPNPASQNCYLSTKGRMKGAGIVRIFNANGQVLSNQQVQDLSVDIELKVGQLLGGFYLITAEGAEGIMHGKLFIQN